MRQITAREANQHFAKVLSAVEGGEQVVISKRGKPVAVMSPYKPARDAEHQAAVDQMIAALLNANGRDDFVSSVRALDRVLVSGHYTIPLFHLPEQWLARWKSIRLPETPARSGYLPETWWRETN